jgi:hypothetical protein
MSHWVRGHFRNGRWVRPHRRRNPGRRSGGSTIAITASITVTVSAASFAGINLLKSKPSTPKQSRSPASSLSIEAHAGFKRAEAALKARHFQARLTTTKPDDDCAVQSYGQVRSYFQSNPCKRMARAYIQVGEVGQHLVLVAVSWVAMPTTTSAKDLKRLIDIGAGDIIELSRETTLFKYITYEGSIHVSGIRETSVWNVKAMPMFSATRDDVNRVIAASRQQ